MPSALFRCMFTALSTAQMRPSQGSQQHGHPASPPAIWVPAAPRAPDSSQPRWMASLRVPLLQNSSTIHTSCSGRPSSHTSTSCATDNPDAHRSVPGVCPARRDAGHAHNLIGSTLHLRRASTHGLPRNHISRAGRRRNRCCIMAAAQTAAITPCRRAHGCARRHPPVCTRQTWPRCGGGSACDAAAAPGCCRG